MAKTRKSEIERETKETDIKLLLNLDGTGVADISTGVGFLDHMLTAFSVHSGFDLTVRAVGDLQVDAHHTVEDIGIVLGQAFAECIRDKEKLARYGFFPIPMDEALAQAAVDISGRPYLVFNVEFKAFKVGDMETQLVKEFFRAFTMNAGITLHINIPYGENDHHMIEAAFKAVAHALAAAVEETRDTVLSSKGRI
jgi:imidazoleglycerol-phosphate dehydratase